MSLEVAEIASKVLDWQSSNPLSKSSTGGFGIQVCKEYLLLIEEISQQCDHINVRRKEIIQTQMLMFEVFKRVINNESDEQGAAEKVKNN